MKLSVIIPSYQDKYNKNTVEGILKSSALGDQLEIIVVMDGFWFPKDWIVSDPRVRYVHLGKNRGMRGAINAGVALAQGEFIMRTDEHVMFGQGFDKIITDACQPNQIMTAVRYFLDPVKWERMDIPPYIYEKLKIRGEGTDQKFEGQRWDKRDRKRKDVMIDETFAMQGSFWIMPRKWWKDVIGELDTETYGPLIQDSHEMAFKTWKAGGKLILNKNTWYAHKHYSFPRTHQNGTKENPANNEAGYAKMLEIWKPYYEEVIVPRQNA